MGAYLIDFLFTTKVPARQSRNPKAVFTTKAPFDCAQGILRSRRKIYHAKTSFDRSTQLTALRPSKGILTTRTSSTLLRVILKEIEG